MHWALLVGVWGLGGLGADVHTCISVLVDGDTCARQCVCVCMLVCVHVCVHTCGASADVSAVFPCGL